MTCWKFNPARRFEELCMSLSVNLFYRRKVREKENVFWEHFWGWWIIALKKVTPQRCKTTNLVCLKKVAYIFSIVIFIFARKKKTIIDIRIVLYGCCFIEPLTMRICWSGVRCLTTKPIFPVRMSQWSRVRTAVGLQHIILNARSRLSFVLVLPIGNRPDLWALRVMEIGLLARSGVCFTTGRGIQLTSVIVCG